MKTLASCTPVEFLKQSNRIRKSVEKWLTDTDILNIRQRLPHREIASIDATDEERQEIEEKNKKAVSAQIRKNLSAILDAVMDDHAEETIEVLALCCFIEPEDANNHMMSEYLGALGEILNDENVMSFFTSLARMERMTTQSA